MRAVHQASAFLHGKLATHIHYTYTCMHRFSINELETIHTSSHYTHTLALSQYAHTHTHRRNELEIICSFCIVFNTLHAHCLTPKYPITTLTHGHTPTQVQRELEAIYGFCTSEPFGAVDVVAVMKEARKRAAADGGWVCMCVVCVRTRVCMLACACVHACVRATARAYACVHASRGCQAVSLAHSCTHA